MTRFRRSIAGSAGVPLLAAGMALLLGACASAGTPTWSFPQAQARKTDQGARSAMLAGPPAAAPVSMLMSGRGGMSMSGAGQQAAPLVAPGVEPQVAVPVSITIVTGDMIGHTEFPAFVPSDLTLPANSTVVVTITNFDDATALPRGSEQYAKVSGTVGDTASVAPINLAYPNRPAGPSRTIASIDPVTVSHTFTVAGLGINVPIPAHARETFTIHTGAPGVYTWHCMDPCGNGPTGWGTAMSTKQGFMEGTIRVV